MFNNLDNIIKAFMITDEIDYKKVYKIQEVSIRDFLKSMHISIVNKITSDFMFIMCGRDKIYIDSEVQTNGFNKYMGSGSPLESGVSTSTWWEIDDLTNDLKCNIKFIERCSTFYGKEKEIRIRRIYEGISLKN